METRQKPFVNPRIFWDVEVDSLDFETHKKMIVERVFERGDVGDIRAARRFYPNTEIEKILLSARHLSPGRLHLASAIIDQPLESFACYTQRQLSPRLSPY
jgi:hypothetical protein